MTKMFGTNGVRGVVNEDMNAKLALQMGKAIGSCFPGIIAIAKDTRVSSDMLSMAVISGLTTVGCDVRDLGMIPTPALQLYVKTHGEVVAGVMITASHNPPEYNGIKVIAGDGTEASTEQEAAVEAKYDEEIQGVSWSRVGSVRKVTGAAEEYIDSIISKVDVNLIRSAGFTAVVDCANGASCYTSPLLLQKLGVRAIALNASANGEFPGHNSEPTEDNLSDLKKLVKDVKADIGIAHDGDADRCVFVDNKGNFVSGDITLALMAMALLEANNGGEVVTPVATSSLIDEVVVRGNGTVARTAVGSPKVARRMIDDHAVFGGEGNGGLIFPAHQYCRDGGMAVAYMLEFLAKGNTTLRKKIDELPVYYGVKKKIPCPMTLKSAVYDYIRSVTTTVKKDETDGIKLLFGNGWVHIRASGTEPQFRVESESADEVVANQLSEKYEKLVSDFITANTPSE